MSLKDSIQWDLKLTPDKKGSSSNITQPVSNEEKIHVQDHTQQDQRHLHFLLTDTTPKKGSLSNGSFQRCLTFYRRGTKDQRG